MSIPAIQHPYGHQITGHMRCYVSASIRAWISSFRLGAASAIIALGFVPNAPLYPATMRFHPSYIGYGFSNKWRDRQRGDLRLGFPADERSARDMYIIVRRVEIVYDEAPDYDEERGLIDRYEEPPAFCLHGMRTDSPVRRFLGDTITDSPDDERNWEITPVRPLPVRVYITLDGNREVRDGDGWGPPGPPHECVGRYTDVCFQIIRDPDDSHPDDAQLSWSTEIPPEAIDW